MTNYDDNAELPLDEILDSDEDDVVTLTTADGEEIDFIEIAGIAHAGSYYVILQPVELLDGMDDDEALVFEVKSIGEDAQYSIVVDDDIIDAVFEEYNKMLDDAGDGE